MRVIHSHPLNPFFLARLVRQASDFYLFGSDVPVTRGRMGFARLGVAISVGTPPLQNVWRVSVINLTRDYKAGSLGYVDKTELVCLIRDIYMYLCSVCIWSYEYEK